MKKYDAACIGTCILDISAAGLDFETYLENEPNLADSVTYSPGGDANNESVVMSRLGMKTCLLSLVGDDFIGRYVLDTASAAGVDVSHVKVTRAVPTAANMILIGADDRRVYTVGRGGTSRTELALKDIDLEVIKNARLVSVASIFANPKLDEGLFTILRTAKEAGAITCADVSPSGEGDSLEPLKEALGYLDYLFANADEARQLSGRSAPEEMGGYFLGLGVGTVIIKFGKEGCIVKNAAGSFRGKAYPVEAVDTTGAGDNFASGFMAALLNGKSLEECAKYGAACGALAVGQVGATSGAASMEQVEEFLRLREKQ